MSNKILLFKFVHLCERKRERENSRILRQKIIMIRDLGLHIFYILV